MTADPEGQKAPKFLLALRGSKELWIWQRLKARGSSKPLPKWFFMQPRQFQPLQLFLLVALD